MIPKVLQLQMRSTPLAISAKELQQPRSLALAPVPWVCQRCISQRRAPLRRRKESCSLNTVVSSKRTVFSKSAPSATATEHEKRRTVLFLSSHGYNLGSRYASSNAQDELPSQEESRRSPISKRFNHVMDHLQSNLFIAGQRLNDLTGYSGIEALKRDIEEQG